MPICPDCSQYSADFASGRCDPQDGTWYCSQCWVRFDQEEKKERLKLGYVLPEDRVLWYSPGSVLTSTPASESLSSWCHEGPLLLEVLDPLEPGKPNQWRIDLNINDDFLICGSRCSSVVVLGQTVPVISIHDFFPSPHLAADSRHTLARKFVRISRQERKLLKSIESRAKAKAAAEVEAKKRELLEIAKRRAQLKKKPGKLQLVKKKVDMWKSEHASTKFPTRIAGAIHDSFLPHTQTAEPPAKRPRLDSQK